MIQMSNKFKLNAIMLVVVNARMFAEFKEYTTFGTVLGESDRVAAATSDLASARRATR
jgi:hypothetical protein